MPLAGENMVSSVMEVGLVYGSAPLTQASAGTVSSGTTETFDAVLGYLPVTLILGHWYRAIIDGLVGQGSVAADSYSLTIRNSQSASNPTSSSARVAYSEYYVPVAGSPGWDGAGFSFPFQCVVGGVNTFGFSVTRNSGTGTFTPAGTRALYVVDLGGN